jgi:hypothetical protein
VAQASANALAFIGHSERRYPLLPPENTREPP